MSRLTNYKIKAFIYDLYVKCNDKKNGKKIDFTLRSLTQYHHLGNMIENAISHYNLIIKAGDSYVWNQNEPNEKLIQTIIDKKTEIELTANKRYRENQLENKGLTTTGVTSYSNNEEINQYRDALEKALLRINELEKKEELKQPEKKSFIAKLFN
jgi:hypothetical protein